ncbi:MAG: trypsin-like peptidase domain-containing protein [Planctomycetota bacterium]
MNHLLAHALLVAIPWVSTPQSQEPFQFNRKTPVVQVVERFGDCVLSVSTARHRRSRSIFELNRQDSGLGSGVIIDPAGYVITNAHVIAGADAIDVKLLDGRELPARLMKSDPDNDLALLKIDANEPFPYIPFGNSDDLLIGETVIALGNPYGLSNTVTTGVLSAKNRSVPTGNGHNYDDFLQTDASINPGNSGGALLNINGELVGINTAILRQGQGIGFAIPVDRVSRVLPDLIDLPVARGLSIGADFDTITGRNGEPEIVVASVETDSSAARYGLRQGDKIRRLDGERVETLLDFKKQLLEKEAGDTLSLAVERGDGFEDIRLPVEPVETVTRRQFLRKLGFWGEAKLVRIRDGRMISGFVIDEVRQNSPATSLGLRVDDVIYKGLFQFPNQRRFEVSMVNKDLFFAACKYAQTGDEIIVELLRRGEELPLKGTLVVGE